MHEEIDAETNALARAVVDAALKGHKVLGPGLLESAYEACLAHELSSRGLVFRTQVSLPITYGGIRLDAGLRLDMVAGERLVVELESVESLLPIHESRVITYLKLSGLRLALLMNFNVRMLRDGIKRIAYWPGYFTSVHAPSLVPCPYWKISLSRAYESLRRSFAKFPLRTMRTMSCAIVT